MGVLLNLMFPSYVIVFSLFVVMMFSIAKTIINVRAHLASRYDIQTHMHTCCTRHARRLCLFACTHTHTPTHEGPFMSRHLLTLPSQFVQIRRKALNARAAGSQDPDESRMRFYTAIWQNTDAPHSACCCRFLLQ